MGLGLSISCDAVNSVELRRIPLVGFYRVIKRAGIKMRKHNLKNAFNANIFKKRKIAIDAASRKIH